MVTRNQNGIRTGDFKSLGQFDLAPDSQVYLGTLTLNAAPFPGLDPDIARSLGFFSVDLQSDDFTRTPPSNFAGYEQAEFTQFHRAMKKLADQANFDREFVQKFKTELHRLLDMTPQRLADGPIR